MQAAYCDSYGPASSIIVKEVPKPIASDDQVLVKVYSSSVTTGNVKLRNFKGMSFVYRFFGRLAFGIFKPRNKVIGSEFAGTVESIGKNVNKFKVGDKVYGLVIFGANAEYLCASQDKICKMPTNFDFDQAATIPFGAATAIQFLQDIPKGKSILINGASGGVGLYAVQLSKLQELEVTGVSSGVNKDLVLKMGANDILDYTKVDIFKTERQFDYILDIVGNINYKLCKHMLTSTGQLLKVNAEIGDWFSKGEGQQKVVCKIVAADKVEVFLKLNGLIESGKLISHIEKRFELKEIVEAHEHVENGHKVGSVVIVINKDINK